MILNWTVTAEDQALITRIAWRAHELGKRLGLRGRQAYSVQDATMDVTAVHTSGRPLRLAELLAGDDGNFAHDVFGIRRHLNRDTGQLLDCFTPRFSVGGR